MDKENNVTNTEEKIINVKDRPSVVAYLEFLQNVISRMGGNSANIKAVIAVIHTIFSTMLITVKTLKDYWWVGLIIATIGMIMDAYYLALERMYRKRYNNFVKKINEGQLDEKEIYNMNPKNTDLKYEVIAVMLESLKSFSVVGFYVLMMGVTVLLKYI